MPDWNGAAQMYADFKWAEDMIADFEYKPGWKFTVDLDHMTGLVALLIRFRAPDSRLPDREVHGLYADVDFYCSNCGNREQAAATVPVGNRQIFPQYLLRDRNEQHFKQWLRHVILSTEVHETDEWFRFQGELINDPHAQAGAG